MDWLIDWLIDWLSTVVQSVFTIFSSKYLFLVQGILRIWPNLWNAVYLIRVIWKTAAQSWDLTMARDFSWGLAVEIWRYRTVFEERNFSFLHLPLFRSKKYECQEYSMGGCFFLCDAQDDFDPLNSGSGDGLGVDDYVSFFPPRFFRFALNETIGLHSLFCCVPSYILCSTSAILSSVLRPAAPTTTTFTNITTTTSLRKIWPNPTRRRGKRVGTAGPTTGMAVGRSVRCLDAKNCPSRACCRPRDPPEASNPSTRITPTCERFYFRFVGKVGFFCLISIFVPIRSGAAMMVEDLLDDFISPEEKEQIFHALEEVIRHWLIDWLMDSVDRTFDLIDWLIDCDWSMGRSIICVRSIDWLIDSNGIF